MTLDFDDRDRRSVVGDLASDDAEVRRLAVERAAALPAGEAVPLLLERLGDASWRVRKAAIERLVAFPDGSGVEDGLLAALADGENSGRRNAAVEALVRCGARLVPRLISEAGGDDPDVRKFAVDALAGIGDPAAAAALVTRLRDEDANVRAAAADALAAVGGAAAEKALREASVRDSEVPLVRFSALRGLETLGVQLAADDLAPALGDPTLRTAALALLGRAGDEAAESILFESLGSSSRATREASIRALLRLFSRTDDAGRRASFRDRVRARAGECSELVDDALTRLAEADLATRLMLVQFLGLFDRDEAVVAILRASCDEALFEVALGALADAGDRAERAIDAVWDALDAEQRRAACVLFGRTRGERGGARLLAALEEPAPEIRTAAARSVGERGLAAGLALLVRGLEAAAEDDDLEAEAEVAALCDALIALAGPGAAPDVTARAVELLTSRLEGAPETVRFAIATVLGGIGRREDAELVAFLLKDPAPDVRRAAVDALARLDPGSAAEPLRLALADESPLVRIAAAAALGSSRSPEVFADLQSLADDEDALVRAAAVRALGARLAQPGQEPTRAEAQARLTRALGDDPPVALAALKTLRELGSGDAPRVVSVLTRDEPEVLQEAVLCLAAIGEPAHVDALLPLVSHPDWSVRAEAIGVLGERGRSGAVPAILRRLETEQDTFVREVILGALRRLEG